MRDKTITVYLRYNCLMKHFRLILSFVLLSLLFNTTPAYADGGIPLWIYAHEYAFSSLAFKTGLFDANFLHGLIFLLLVIIVEIIVFQFLDKNKKISIKEKLYSLTLANIFSTIAGVILIVPILYLTQKSNILNYFVIFELFLLLLHVICFFISYYIELWTYNKFFNNKLEFAFIKKVALWTNIWTYFILNPLIIILLICSFLQLGDYLNHLMPSITDKRENVKMLDSSVMINDVKIITPSFSPKAVSIIECQNLKKNGYNINGSCEFKKHRHDVYFEWVDAKRQCEDVGGKLPSYDEILIIVRHVYNIPLDTKISKDRYTTNLNFNSTKAKQINFPIEPEFYVLFDNNYPFFWDFHDVSTGFPIQNSSWEKAKKRLYAICVAK